MGPLEWFYGDGVILDFRHKNPRELIAVKDLKEALKEISYKIKPRRYSAFNDGRRQALEFL
jgi:kynurenine formamidase